MQKNEKKKCLKQPKVNDKLREKKEKRNKTKGK